MVIAIRKRHYQCLKEGKGMPMLRLLWRSARGTESRRLSGRHIPKEQSLAGLRGLDGVSAGCRKKQESYLQRVFRQQEDFRDIPEKCRYLKAAPVPGMEQGRSFFWSGRYAGFCKVMECKPPGICRYTAERKV